MTEREPARLLDEEATPAALRDALQALRDRAPSEASAARISERLHDPPQARGSGAPLATLAVLGLGALIAFYAWPGREPSEPATPSAPPAPAPAPLAAPPPAAPAAMPSTPLAPATLVPEQPRELAPKEIAAKPVLREPAAPAVEPADPSPSEAPAVKPAPPRSVAARIPVAVPEPEPAPPSEPMPAPVVDSERPFADPQDEAGLLYRAKRLSSSDPKAALRLIAVHETSFPAGAFAEERDMLEIQIHRRLGHAATAKRLAAIFRQRYPSSVYRVSP